MRDCALLASYGSRQIVACARLENQLPTVERILLSLRTSSTLSPQFGINFWQFVVCRTLAPGILLYVIFQTRCLKPAALQDGTLVCRQMPVWPDQPLLTFNSLSWGITPFPFPRQCFFHLCSHEHVTGAPGRNWTFLCRRLVVLSIYPASAPCCTDFGFD